MTSMGSADTYKHQGLRRQLVKQLALKGIKNEKVLNAIENVPRHLFLDNAFLQFAAYEDKAFKIAAGQTISQPYTVAYQTELLEIVKGEKVLEVGTGSGYQTSILLELGAKVYSIERQKVLFEKAKIMLDKLGYAPRLFFGDGYKGLPSFAPFDKIIVTAGAPFVPDELLTQLKTGGILVIPVGDETVQKMISIKKISASHFERKEHDNFSFVPLLENKAN